MIIVKNAEFTNIAKIINVERTFAESLEDSIVTIQNSDKDVLRNIENYISKNGVINGISENVRREISGKHTLFDAMVFALKNSQDISRYIEAKLKKSNKKIFDTATITYQEKGMFDWLNTISFFANYTSKLVDILLTQPQSINNYLTKADFEYINKTVNYYRTVMKRLCDSLKNIQRSIDMLSTEQYDPEFSSIIEEAKGKEAVETGLAPHHFNPIYWASYVAMRWDVNTLESNQDKIRLYAAKLQRLELEKNRSSDPSLDAQIEYWENQIQVLDAESEDIRAKYAK